VERVAHEIAAGIGPAAEIEKNRPVPRPRRNDRDAVVIPQAAHEFDSPRERCWRIKHPRMRQDPKASAQHTFGNGAGFSAIDRTLEPLTELSMSLRLLTMRIQQHIHVEEDHRVSIRSIRPAELSRSTPGNTPRPRKVGRRVGSPTGLAAVAAIVRWRPSSTSALSVQRRSRANFFACRSNSVWMATVVRMHQSMTAMHHDVNHCLSIFDFRSGTAVGDADGDFIQTLSARRPIA